MNFIQHQNNDREHKRTTNLSEATALGAAHTPGQVGRLQRLSERAAEKKQNKKKRH